MHSFLTSATTPYTNRCQPCRLKSLNLNRFIILLLITFTFYSCQNYENEEYIKIENEAINDLILEITQFEQINRLKNKNRQKLKLYVISTLDTTTAFITKPNGYIIGENGVNFTEEKIEENKKEFEENLEKLDREQQLFSDFKRGKIKKRKLNYNLTNEELKIIIIDRENIKSLQIKENEFGYLFMSRIVFKNNFTTGYLSFGFFCGDGCAWNSNIEIKKVNGKWKISEYFSRGIS